MDETVLIILAIIASVAVFAALAAAWPID